MEWDAGNRPDGSCVKRIALRSPMQRAAMAHAACCDGCCTALRHSAEDTDVGQGGADGLYTQSPSRPCKPLSIRPPDTVRAPAFILGKKLLSHFFLIARRLLRAAWDAVGDGGTSRGCASLGLDFVGQAGREGVCLGFRVVDKWFAGAAAWALTLSSRT